jgi:hypothetical protein
LARILRAPPRASFLRAPDASQRNFLFRTDQQHRAPDADDVAMAKQPQLHGLAIDLGAVGASQVGEHQFALILLDLQVKPADPLIVELDRIALFAADGDRRGETVVHPSPVRSIQDPQRDQRHDNSLNVLREVPWFPSLVILSTCYAGENNLAGDNLCGFVLA